MQGGQDLPTPGVEGGDGVQLPVGPPNTKGDWRTLGCPDVFLVPWSHRWMLGVMLPYPPPSCCCSLSFASNLVFFSKSPFLFNLGYDREVQAPALLCPNFILGCTPLIGLLFEIPI